MGEEYKKYGVSSRKLGKLVSFKKRTLKDGTVVKTWDFERDARRSKRKKA